MENISAIMCMREEDLPLSVKFDCEPDYRYESHYGKHTVVDNNTGLILEWTGDNPESGTLKKDGVTLFIVIPKGREQEEYLAEKKAEMIEWYKENNE